MEKEIGKLYEVVVAERTDGTLETEIAKLIQIDYYRNKKIYIFEPDIPNQDLWVEYEKEKDEPIDWDFISEVYDYFNNLPTFK